MSISINRYFNPIIQLFIKNFINVYRYKLAYFRRKLFLIEIGLEPFRQYAHDMLKKHVNNIVRIQPKLTKSLFDKKKTLLAAKKFKDKSINREKSIYRYITETDQV